MSDRILVDANSLGHAAHQGTVLKAGDQETQAVYGVLKGIRALKVAHPDSSLLMLWDGLSWRKGVSAVYKGNRQDTSDKVASRKRYASQTPFLRRALKHLAVPQLAAANLEADDLAALLVRKAREKGDFIRLVTGDQDWLQLVGPDCIWEDHRDSTKRVNHRNFEKFTGCKDAIQFVQAKAMQGDISDNLPGVGGIGEGLGGELLKVWGRIEAFFADPDPKATWDLKAPMASRTNKKTGVTTTKAKSYPKAIDDFHNDVDGRHEKFFHNHAMMNLNGDLPAPERMILAKGEFDADAFKAVCHELGFASIYRPDRFDDFIAPFQSKALN